MRKYSILIILFCFLLTINSFTIYYGNLTLQAEKKLDFIFLLHANQANVPYGDVANDLCYHAVLESMLDHPTLHFPLHFSGTLLTDLMWFNSSTIDLIKQGIESGQFEIIGSTYAQNVMYSHSDDYDNEIQIEKHRQVIKEILDVEPTGFWNPERCWNQERYVNLIAGGNYKYTFLEDQILNNSFMINGNDEYKVRNTSTGQHDLLLINDDKTIINYVDNIAFTTEPASSVNVVSAVDNLISYLEDVYNNDLTDEYCVFYGQDMEAWGLWQEEGHPSDTLTNVIDRLDYLFERLEAESNWLNVNTPTEFLNNLPLDYEFEFVSNIANGSADWMESPSINEGYKNWFDFSANDSRLNDYRLQFAITRDRLKEIDSSIIQQKNLGQDITAAEKLMSYAQFVFAANQYEFGCIGCYFPWYYRSKSALLTAEAALFSLNPNSVTESLSIDLDHDNNNELVLRNQFSMFIFSGIGGRLINWYDIQKGDILLANDIPATYATWTVQGLGYDSGTPLSSPIDTISGDDLWSRTTKEYQLRPKAFLDEYVDRESAGIWYRRNRTTIIGDNFIEFSLSFSNRAISKVFLLDDDSTSLQVSYSITNDEISSIQSMIGMFFSPGNEEILYKGKDTLNQQIIANDSHYSVLTDNIFTKTRILSELPKVGLNQVSEDSNDPLFAKGFTITLDETEAASTSVYTFKLIQEEITEYNQSTQSESSDTVSKSINLDLQSIFATPLIMIVIRYRKQRNTV